MYQPGCGNSSEHLCCLLKSSKHLRQHCGKQAVRPACGASLPQAILLLLTKDPVGSSPAQALPAALLSALRHNTHPRLGTHPCFSRILSKTTGCRPACICCVLPAHLLGRLLLPCCGKGGTVSTPSPDVAEGASAPPRPQTRLSHCACWLAAADLSACRDNVCISLLQGQRVPHEVAPGVCRSAQLPAQTDMSCTQSQVAKRSVLRITGHFMILTSQGSL